MVNYLTIIFCRERMIYESYLFKAKEETNADALKLLEQVKDENILFEIKSLILTSKEDGDDAYLKAEKRTKEFRAILANAKNAVQWPTKVRDAEEKIQMTKKMLEQYGSNTEKQKFVELEKEVHNVISEKDEERLLKSIDQLWDFYFSVVYKQPSFWLKSFGQLKELIENMDDGENKKKAKQLIIKSETHVAM